MTEHAASCFCGAVTFTVTGAPKGMGYCHCADCRAWAAAPINAFSLWPLDAIRITKGEDQIATFNKSPKSFRKFCKTCGGHLMTQHPNWQLIDVYTALIPTFDFQPTVHVHYQETVLPLRDGLPKMKDLPAEMGGSGTVLPE